MNLSPTCTCINIIFIKHELQRKSLMVKHNSCSQTFVNKISKCSLSESVYEVPWKDSGVCTLIWLACMSAVLSVPVWLEVWVSEWGVLPWTLHPSLSPYYEERHDQVLQRWVAGSYFCVTWQGALKCCVIVWRCIVKLFFCFLVILRTSLLLLKKCDDS